LLRFPDLLDAEGEDLRVLAPYALPLEPGLGEEPARAFGEGRDLGDDVGRRHVAPGRLAAAVEPRRRGPDACDAVAVDEELAGGEAGEDVDAEPLGLFAEPADDLGDRGDVVPVVPHRGRGGEPGRAPLGQEVDALAPDGRAEREILVLEFWEELPERDGVDDCAREAVFAELIRLLEHGDLDVADPAAGLVVALDETGQLDRAGEACGPAADEN